MKKQKVTIVTSRTNRFGNEMTLPIDGQVTVSEAGEVKVSEKAAAHLVANGLDWEYKEKPAKSDNVATTMDTSMSAPAEEEKPEAKEKAKEEEKPADETVDLSKKTVRELKEICDEVGLPKKDWDNLRKPKLIEYIEKKIK